MFNKLFWITAVLSLWFAKERFWAELLVDHAQRHPSIRTMAALPENDRESLEMKNAFFSGVK